MTEPVAPEKTTHEDTTEQTQQPSQYSVVLMNSDYAEITCILRSLIETFGVDEQRANHMTMQAHMHGEVCVATYSKDIAETKAEQAQETLKALHTELGLEEPSYVYQAIPYKD